MSKEIRKYFDIGPASIATTNVYTGGTTGWQSGVADGNTSTLLGTTWVTGLSQSDDDQGRIGQSINVETLDVRIKISPDNSSASATTHTLRMIIFADNECDGAIPVINGEVLGPTASTVATGLVMSFLNPSYFGRFKIIEDRFWCWSQNAGQVITPLNPDHKMFSESHHDMKNHRVMWDTTNSSGISNARKGHIFISWIYECDVVAVGGIITATTATPPGVQITTRIRYTDTV